MTMKNLALLVSPLAKQAFFSEYIHIATMELNWLLGEQQVAHTRIGDMDFLELSAPDEQLSVLARLSFVQGIFERVDDRWLPLPVAADFDLHEDFVYGAKFRGKTNEMLTQMLIGVGLGAVGCRDASTVKLLDPMCGRATTLLWGMRYGMKTRGIEQDVRALADIRQNVKKWCKIHRQKHEFNEGFVGKANKQNRGKFLEFRAGNAAMRVVAGDASEATTLLKGETFHLIVSDLPYGVQHFSSDKTRNPLNVLRDCAQGWSDSLKPGGAMVLAFNRYLPKREELIAAFESQSLEVLEFEVPHRMSESIVRDVLVMRKLTAAS